MGLTIKDLQRVADQENKKVYKTIYNMVEQAFNRVPYGLDLPLDNERLKVLGTCGIYLRSITELLHTINELLHKGFIESAGSITTVLWERAITFRKILLDPTKNAQIHTEHEQAKKTPWPILAMVKDVTKKHSTNPDKLKDEIKLFYLQYTFLSAIKHGNPYTISYLNRPGRTISDENIFSVQGNDCLEDEDLKLYLLLLAMDNALDALIEFTAEFRDDASLTEVKEIRRFLNKIQANIPLNVPKTMITSPEEMGQEFWDFLLTIDATPQPTITGNLI